MLYRDHLMEQDPSLAAFIAEVCRRHPGTEAFGPHVLAIYQLWKEHHGENTPESRAHFEKLKTLLKEADGGADQVIRALKHRHDRVRGNRRKRIATELTYFRRQHSRMDYARYLREGLPIASGVMEAACKTLATQRLKRSGMVWATAGGQGVLTLRSLIQSNRWKSGWRLLSDSYRKDVKEAACSV